MNELMTEYLPNARCAPSLKAALRAVADQSVSKDMADHIRFAVQSYIDGGVTLDHALALDAVAEELQQVTVKRLATRGEILAALLNHWETTKADCYGKAFAG